MVLLFFNFHFQLNRFTLFWRYIKKKISELTSLKKYKDIWSEKHSDINHNIFSFRSTGTSITICFKTSAVVVIDFACTIIYYGSFELSLSKSFTLFFFFAENSNLCLRFGKWYIIATRCALNPASRIWSASSETKIWLSIKRCNN